MRYLRYLFFIVLALMLENGYSQALFTQNTNKKGCLAIDQYKKAELIFCTIVTSGNYYNNQEDNYQVTTIGYFLKLISDNRNDTLKIDNNDKDLRMFSEFPQKHYDTLKITYLTPKMKGSKEVNDFKYNGNFNIKFDNNTTGSLKIGRQLPVQDFYFKLLEIINISQEFDKTNKNFVLKQINNNDIYILPKGLIIDPQKIIIDPQKNVNASLKQINDKLTKPQMTQNDKKEIGSGGISNTVDGNIETDEEKYATLNQQGIINLYLFEAGIDTLALTPVKLSRTDNDRILIKTIIKLPIENCPLKEVILQSSNDKSANFQLLSKETKPEKNKVSFEHKNKVENIRILDLEQIEKLMQPGKLNNFNYFLSQYNDTLILILKNEKTPSCKEIIFPLKMQEVKIHLFKEQIVETNLLQDLVIDKLDFFSDRSHKCKQENNKLFVPNILKERNNISLNNIESFGFIKRKPDDNGTYLVNSQNVLLTSFDLNKIGKTPLYLSLKFITPEGVKDFMGKYDYDLLLLTGKNSISNIGEGKKVKQTQKWANLIEDNRLSYIIKLKNIIDENGLTFEGIDVKLSSQDIINRKKEVFLRPEKIINNIHFVKVDCFDQKWLNDTLEPIVFPSRRNQYPVHSDSLKIILSKVLTDVWILDNENTQLQLYDSVSSVLDYYLTVKRKETVKKILFEKRLVANSSSANKSIVIDNYDLYNKKLNFYEIPENTVMNIKEGKYELPDNCNSFTFTKPIGYDIYNLDGEKLKNRYMPSTVPLLLNNYDNEILYKIDELPQFHLIYVEDKGFIYKDEKTGNTVGNIQILIDTISGLINSLNKNHDQYLILACDGLTPIIHTSNPDENSNAFLGKLRFKAVSTGHSVNNDLRTIEKQLNNFRSDTWSGVIYPEILRVEIVVHLFVSESTLKSFADDFFNKLPQLFKYKSTDQSERDSRLVMYNIYLSKDLGAKTHELMRNKMTANRTENYRIIYLPINETNK